MPGKIFTSEGAFDNTDIDAIYEPIGIFVPVANVGYTDGGVDLSQLYAPLPEGGAAGPTVIRTSVGAWSNHDLSDIFALLGSVSADPVVWSGSPNINCYNTTPPVAPTVNNYYIQVDATFGVSGANGVWSFSSSEGDNFIPPNPGPYVQSIYDHFASSASGTWSTDSPVGADFEIRLASKSGNYFTSLGDLGGLGVGTWYSLSVSRTWTYQTEAKFGVDQQFLNFEMRHIPSSFIAPVTFEVLYGMET